MTQLEKIAHLKMFYPALPDNLTVGGSLDLAGTQITALPDNLTVGGLLFLRGTQITGAVYDCGELNREIYAYNHPEKGRVVSLGCFVGTLKECIMRIKAKYRGNAAAKYCAKVEQAFAFTK